MRQLLDLVIKQSIAELHVQLALDRRNGPQIAEDDLSHSL